MKKYYKAAPTILVVILLSLVFAPKKAVANCLDDLEILSLVEFEGKTACSTYGEMQLEYLRGSFVSSFHQGDFEERHSDYRFSRLAFGSSKLGMRRISAESLDTFLIALLASSFYGELEGKRSALYTIAYVGMANALNVEKPWKTSALLRLFYENVEFDYDFEGNDVVLFAMCFWEYDIPTLPVQAVYKSDAVSRCIKENPFNF